jgi:S-formylglutathione hydrolase
VQHNRLSTTILIDQGLDDPYLAEQLHPHLFEDACRQANQAIVLRRHQGYDHGYYFIQTFIADHVRHHARQMSEAG